MLDIFVWPVIYDRYYWFDILYSIHQCCFLDCRYVFSFKTFNPRNNISKENFMYLELKKFKSKHYNSNAVFPVFAEYPISGIEHGPVVRYLSLVQERYPPQGGGGITQLHHFLLRREGWLATASGNLISESWFISYILTIIHCRT